MQKIYKTLNNTNYEIKLTFGSKITECIVLHLLKYFYTFNERYTSVGLLMNEL